MGPGSGAGAEDWGEGPGTERAGGETGTERAEEWDRGVGPGQRALRSGTGTDRIDEWDRDRGPRLGPRMEPGQRGPGSETGTKDRRWDRDREHRGV